MALKYTRVTQLMHIMYLSSGSDTMYIGTTVYVLCTKKGHKLF